MMRSTSGISALHSRNTSDVQAARCSAVPIAKLKVEKVASAAARTKPLQMCFTVSPCLATIRSIGIGLAAAGYAISDEIT